MQNRGQLVNKLALVLLSIVVLELVLIGDQVQPVKAIKKKIALKKLKKLLPLLALVKPKKKIILVPIPFPMFKNHGQQRPHYPQQQQQRPHQSSTMMLDAGSAPPMSFVMMQEPGGGSGLVLDSMSMQMSPGGQMVFASPPSPANSTSSSPMIGFGEDSAMMMNMPSMTMTIQSELANGSSAIELSTNMMSAPTNSTSSSSRLRAPPAGALSAQRWRPNYHTSEQLLDEPSQQSLQQQHLPGGEQYYSSPWLTKSPLSSPAKVFRQRAPTSGRLQQQQAPPRPPQQPHQQPKAAVIMIRNQWRPAPLQQQQQHPNQFVQQQLVQAPEIEELVPIGPAQMLPVYQTANGQLHMSPPPTSQRPIGGLEIEGRPATNQQHGNNNADNSEVGLVLADNQRPAPIRATGKTSPPARLTSPAAAAKGKQQQQQSGY